MLSVYREECAQSPIIAGHVGSSWVMPLPLPANYIDVAFDPTLKQYKVWVIQRGHVTSNAVVKTSSTIAVIAKQLGCPVYSDNIDLLHILTRQGVAVIPDRFVP